MQKAEAEALVRAIEAFIDANIASALRQQVPEYAYRHHDMDDLHNARKALIKELMNGTGTSS